MASISHTSVRSPGAGGEVGEGGGDGRLADPTLAGDEEQLRSSSISDRWVLDGTVGNTHRWLGLVLAAEADPAVAVVGADLDVGDLAGRHGDPPAALVGDPQDVGSAGEGGLDGPLDGRALSSSTSTLISRGAWVTPIRTSTAESVRPA